MANIGPIASWRPGRGPVTIWTAAAHSREALRQAPLDGLPPSPQQARHLRAAAWGTQVGQDMARLIIPTWEVDGICDTAAMTEAINIHLRRHDTYHSAFQVLDDGTIERHTVEDPRSIEMRSQAMGYMTEDQIREHVLTSTPPTLDWDCFTFGVVQKIDRFSVYASIDHLYLDMKSAGLLFSDIHMTYQALIHGLPNPLPPTRGYRDHTARQRRYIDTLTPQSPEIRRWLAFARGGMPSFPLPLGSSGPGRVGWVTAELLDAEETRAFEAACHAVGARFSGGVMGCAAMAEHRLTGNKTFQGLTASDARCGESESMSVGWYASLFPVTVPIGDRGFADIARAAQDSFDANKPLAAVPPECAAEFAPTGHPAAGPSRRPPMMVSYMDLDRVPLAGLWADTRFGVYGDYLSHGGINMWVNRGDGRTTVAVSLPETPEARRSVHCYLEVLREVFEASATRDTAAMSTLPPSRPASPRARHHPTDRETVGPGRDQHPGDGSVPGSGGAAEAPGGRHRKDRPFAHCAQAAG